MGCETPGSIQEGPEDVEVVLSACEQPVAYHMVNRRYSEFLNLQTRLEEKTELRKLIKGRNVGSAHISNTSDYFEFSCLDLTLKDPVWSRISPVCLFQV